MRRTKQNTRLVGLAAFWLWALWIPSAQGKSNLRCTVVDETGKPLPKGEMVLKSASDGKEWKRKTDDKGVVEFKGLDDGSYQLRGDVPGFLFAASEPIAVSGNQAQSCHHTLPSVNYYNGLLQGVLEAVKQRKFAEAEQNGKKALELSSQEGAAHYVLAVAYASQGKSQEAVSEAKKAAELNPDKFKAQVMTIQMGALDAQAKAANTKGDFAGAIQKYEEMLTLSPNDANVYYNIALAYGNQKNYDQALKTVDKAIALKPEDTEFQQMKIRLQDLYLKSMDQALEKK